MKKFHIVPSAHSELLTHNYVTTLSQPTLLSSYVACKLTIGTELLHASTDIVQPAFLRRRGSQGWEQEVLCLANQLRATPRADAPSVESFDS